MSIFPIAPFSRPILRIRLLLQSKYIQTQIFDAAFGLRADGPPNANHYWCGRDDTTELYFRDWDHVIKSFNSDYVKTKVGPDARFFADFETSISLMAREKQVELKTRLASERSGRALGQGNTTVAMYFVSTPDNQLSGGKLEPELTPTLTQALEQHCQDDAWGVIANVGEVSEKFDLNAYFGGARAPQYALVYKIYLKGPASVPAVRRSQKLFEDAVKDHIDLHESFIVFSEEVLVMDVGENVRVSQTLLSLRDIKPDTCFSFLATANLSFRIFQDLVIWMPRSSLIISILHGILHT